MTSSIESPILIDSDNDDSDVEILREEKNEDLDLIFVSETIHVKEEDKAVGSDVSTDVGFNRSLSISSNLDLTLRLNDNQPVVPVLHTSLTTDNTVTAVASSHQTPLDLSSRTEYDDITDSSEDESLSSLSSEDDPFESTDSENCNAQTKGSTGSLLSMSLIFDPCNHSSSTADNYTCTGTQSDNSGQGTSTSVETNSFSINNILNGPPPYKQGSSPYFISDSSCSKKISGSSNIKLDSNGFRSVYLDQPADKVQTNIKLSDNLSVQNIPVSFDNQTNIRVNNTSKVIQSTNSLSSFTQNLRNVSVCVQNKNNVSGFSQSGNNVSVSSQNTDNVSGCLPNTNIVSGILPNTNPASGLLQNTSNVSGSLQNTNSSLGCLQNTNSTSTSIPNYTDNTTSVSQAQPSSRVSMVERNTKSVGEICHELLQDLDFLSNTQDTTQPKCVNVTQGIKRSLSEQTHKSKSEDKVLPPKKQIRYLHHQSSDESNSWRSEKCSQCQLSLLGLKLSRCLQGHPSCTTCLEEKVKVVLTGKAKETLHCLKAGCDSYFPLSELNQSLPKMVVDILETKLDDDYIDYISSMILKNATSSDDSALNVNTQQVPVSTPETSYKGEGKQGSFKDLPENWDVMDKKKTHELVVLKAETPEYVDVAFKFHETLKFPDFDIDKVARIQNPILWQYYTVKKSEMVQENDGINVEERGLFHGTQTSVVESICKKGFDWRVCGKNGTVYGQGSYFAVNASYSHQYTDKANHRRQRLQRARMGFLPAPPPAHTGSPSRLLAQRMFQMNSVQQIPITYSLPNAMMMQTSQPFIVNNKQPNGVIITPQTMLPNIIQKQKNNVVQTFNSSQPSNFMVQGGGQPIMPNQIPAPQSSYGQPQVLYQPLPDVATEVPEKKPTHKMILSRVLVGRYTGGKADLRKPPPLFPDEDVYGKCYDSCVDQIQEPKIFVIFDSAQAYPEYLIEYHFND